MHLETPEERRSLFRQVNPPDKGRTPSINIECMQGNSSPVMAALIPRYTSKSNGQSDQTETLNSGLGARETKSGAIDVPEPQAVQ